MPRGVEVRVLFWAPNASPVLSGTGQNTKRNQGFWPFSCPQQSGKVHGQMGVGSGVSSKYPPHTVLHVEARGTNDLARRVFRNINMVPRFAVAHDRWERNPAQDIVLPDFLKPVVTKNHSALTDPVAVDGLLMAIPASMLHRGALRLSPLVCADPRCSIRRSEIDMEHVLDQETPLASPHPLEPESVGKRAPSGDIAESKNPQSQ